MPFRSQAKCLPAFISYLYMSIWAKMHHLTSHQFLHCLLLALCDDGCSGVFKCVHTQRLHVLPSSQNFAIRERCHAQLKNEIMNGNQGFCVNMASKQAKIEFLSHISSLYSTPRCRCCAQTYTPKPRCHTSDTGGLIWAVRLWILGRSPTMYSKCHACILVCKIYNTTKAPVMWKSSQVWVNSALSRRTIQLACLSNLQKYV